MRAGKANWIARTNSADQSLLSFAAVVSWFGGNRREEEKTAWQLAEENAALIKQRIECDQLASIIAQRKEAEVVPIVAQLAEMKKTIGEAGNNKKSLDQELDAALKEWKEKWDKILMSESLFSYRQGAKQGLQQGRESEMKKWQPLAKAGAFIRGRKLDWVRGDRPNESIVECGNQASHYGMALADAALYQSFCPSKRTDATTFAVLYGVEPDFVWERRSIPKFMDILNWRGGMNDFHAHKYAGVNYDSTTFNSVIEPILRALTLSEELEKTSAIRQYFTDNDAKYQTLKKLYGVALAKHKVHLQNK